jgi:hypothetical protein
MRREVDVGDTAGVDKDSKGAASAGSSWTDLVLMAGYSGFRGGGRRSRGVWERGMFAAVRRPLRELPRGDSERVVLAGDHGLVKEILGEGDRGLLTADHGLVRAIFGEGDDSSYLSSPPVSVEYSLVESVVLQGFGMIFLNCGPKLGVNGVRGLGTPDTCCPSISRYS